jgi:hypothetical protein
MTYKHPAVHTAGHFTLAHSQNDTVHLLTKTVSFRVQIKIKQISLSWILITNSL